jgi:hypothetical protein
VVNDDGDAGDDDDEYEVGRMGRPSFPASHVQYDEFSCFATPAKSNEYCKGRPKYHTD